MIGTIKWFDPRKGFGFILADGRPDIFVHYTDIQGEGFRQLHDGEVVEFELTQRPGGLAAKMVRSLDQVDSQALQPRDSSASSALSAGQDPQHSDPRRDASDQRI